MLLSFKNIRRSFVTSGKSKKYFYYALGEILLVMIGILLALQVNNWNENRKERIVEHELLLNFKEEIIKNMDLLNQAMSYSKISMRGARQVVEIYQLDHRDFSSSELDSLLGLCQWAWTYDPIMGVPISVRTSGQINIIQNGELRQFIASFEEMVRDVQEEGKLIREMIVNQFMPMAGEYVSSNNRSHFIGEGYSVVPKSVFSSDYEGFFADRRLEDLITYIHVWRKDQLSEESAFLGQLQYMLDVLNKELERWD